MTTIVSFFFFFFSNEGIVADNNVVIISCLRHRPRPALVNVKVQKTHDAISGNTLNYFWNNNESSYGALLNIPVLFVHRK